MQSAGDISRKGAKEAKVAEKRSPSGLPGEGGPCKASTTQEVIIKRKGSSISILHLLKRIVNYKL
jgi:hypothetical protein